MDTKHIVNVLENVEKIVAMIEPANDLSSKAKYEARKVLADLTFLFELKEQLSK